MENEIENIEDTPVDPEKEVSEMKPETPETVSQPEFPEIVPEKVRAVSVFNIVVFVIIIITGGVLSIILPQKAVSEVEKRRLTQAPSLSLDSIFHGKYTQKFENYYADNFPYRENLVGLASGMKEKFGPRPNDIMMYTLNGDKPNGPATDEEDTTSFDESDTLATNSYNANSDTAHNDAEIVKSVMIYKGRAIQIFGGSKAMAGMYAHMINSYHKALPGVKMYCLVIPTPIDFYLPDKYKHVPQAEKKNIDMIHAALDTGIVPVHAYEEVAAHTNEYLYYFTDHHWTGLGAYYAYRGFCKSAGFAPVELAQMQRKVIHNFLGSLYDLTRDSRVKANIDSVEYFKLPVTTKVTIYPSHELKTFYKASLYAETARGGNAYSVFLGGDAPLVKIETGNPNGRKLLVIKDSYGNALAPYFASHFSEIYVVDYRYFNVNLPNFIRDKKVTDMIFMHNTFAANSKYTSSHEMYLMKMKGGAPAPKTSAKDSLAKKKPMPKKADSTSGKK